MATFYSGRVTVRCTYVDNLGRGRNRMPRDGYRCIVSGPDGTWRGIVHPPAAGYGRGVGYDSRRAYLRTAKAALAFAEDAKPGIADGANFGSTGYVFRTWKRAAPSSDRGRSRTRRSRRGRRSWRR